MSLPHLQLNKDQERRLLAGHLWIYANEVNSTQTPLTSFEPGDLALVFSHQQKPLGIAYVNPHTLLCARILTRNINEKIDSTFFLTRLQRALERRQMIFTEPFYRWIFSESDLLPGLIIDRFDHTVVLQINTAGMERLQETILDALLQFPSVKTVIWRNDTAYREIEKLPLYVKLAHGENVDEMIVKENDCEYLTTLQSGQKTGWFYDHRNNRAQIAKYVNGKKVLDVFSYLGAFTIPSAKAGAAQITCVDSSKSAIDYLNRNAIHNHVAEKIQTFATDAFDFLQTHNNTFDVIIIDPPAFIKKKKEYHQGLRAYEKLNQLALSRLNPGGILLSASCSMHLSASDLLNCIRRASVTLKRPVFILEQLHQGPDHPIHPAIEETNYLKGFIVAT